MTALYGDELARRARHACLELAGEFEYDSAHFGLGLLLHLRVIALHACNPSGIVLKHAEGFGKRPDIIVAFGGPIVDLSLIGMIVRALIALSTIVRTHGFQSRGRARTMPAARQARAAAIGAVGSPCADAQSSLAPSEQRRILPRNNGTTAVGELTRASKRNLPNQLPIIRPKGTGGGQNESVDLSHRPDCRDPGNSFVFWFALRGRP